MMVRATLAVALAIGTCVAATPHQTAEIVNSGSTNSMGYTISLSSDGSATLTLQSRGAGSPNAPKKFTVPAETASRFFADLAAARNGNVATVPCMKSVSFGTSTHIRWQGWVSPDLDCPPKGSLGDALVKDLEAIRQAAGITTPLMRSAPVESSRPPRP
jgi:FtsP/CotA-like multicopper oxidase with cupredoxin domain